MATLGNFEILMSLECTVDSERNGIFNFIVSCSVVELFFRRSHKNPAFNGLALHKTTNSAFDSYTYTYMMYMLHVLHVTVTGT